MFSRPATNAVAAHRTTGYSARIVTARAWLSKKSTSDIGGSTGASGTTKSAHPRDQVASTPEDIELINRSVHHYQEEDLEHDRLGMKDPHHLHRRAGKETTWKEAEEEQKRGGDGEVRKLPDH